MFSFFKNKSKYLLPLGADIHSHLIPGIDDGVKSVEEAEQIIRIFRDAGYKKLVTTPHIMSDHYRNDASTILPRLELLKTHLAGKGIDIAMEAAAEYYLDEVFYQQVNSNAPLLTFGDRYLLFETNYLSEPYQLKDFLFKLTTQGYRPILAHPERYQYMSIEKAEDLRNRGVIFQVNMLSLVGYYSKPIRTMAEELIDRGWVEFLGSDCHNLLHAGEIKRIMKNKYFQRALELPLLNRMI